MTGWTWKCSGCGRQGSRPFPDWDKAQEAGKNHLRGNWGNAAWSKDAYRRTKTCNQSTIAVVPFRARQEP